MGYVRNLDSVTVQNPQKGNDIVEKKYFQVFGVLDRPGSWYIISIEMGPQLLGFRLKDPVNKI